MGYLPERHKFEEMLNIKKKQKGKTMKRFDKYIYIIAGILLAGLLYQGYQSYFKAIYNMGYDAGYNDTYLLVNTERSLFNTLVSLCESTPSESCADTVKDIGRKKMMEKD